ncbi:MAG: peptide deformylase [Microgenomates group bacterium Gr01-1014_16]|nr:MAG: peptide deformylase [Microgenomates group bacterium Gr01-1014_16]
MNSILTAPNPVLRQVAKPVEHLDKRTLGIIEDMISTLKKAKSPEGVGLAATQIGISLRIFLIRPLPNQTITLFINPEIIKFSQRQQSPKNNKGVYEGCLSLPGHYAPITRSMSVTVKYQTAINHELITMNQTFTGFPAHIIQHELDHLNGILFVDRVLEQNTKLFKVDGDSWQEITL